MPNYSLVTDARYDPFSYDEILKPVQAANTLHRQVESAYADIDEKVGMWEILANEERDPQTYARYKAYIDKLYAARDALNARGLTPQTSATLQKIRGSYGSQIKPIEIAYARKGEIEKRRNEADIKSGNTMVREYDTSELSLDRFLDDSMADAGWEFSGEKLKGMVSDMVKNLRNALTEEDYIDLGIDPGIAGTWQHWEKYGYDTDEILDAIMNSAVQGNTRANEILNGMLDQAVASTGVYNIADDARREKCIKELREHGKQAFWEALEKPKIEHVYDHNGGSGSGSGSGGGPNIPETVTPNYIPVTGNSASAKKIKSELSGINTLKSSIGLPVSIGDRLDADYDSTIDSNLNSVNPQSGVIVHRPNPESRNPSYGFGYPYSIKDQPENPPITNSAGELPKLWYEHDTFSNTGGTEKITKKNDLMSKEDFVAQVEDEEDKKALAEYYDYIRRQLQRYVDLTIPENRNYYKIGMLLMDAEKAAMEYSTAKMKNVMEVRFNDPVKVMTERVLPLTTTSNGKETFIQKVDDMDGEGNLKLGSTASVSKIEKAIKDGKSPIYGLSPSKTQPGIIILLDGTTYYVPWNHFGSLANFAQQGYFELEDLWKLRKGTIDEYGEDWYYKSEFGMDLETAIRNTETIVQRQLTSGMNPVATEAKSPSYK